MLTVDVTHPELDAREGVLTVWNLCPSHTAQSPKMSQGRIASLQYTCPRCHRQFQNRVDKSLKLWSRLCAAYDKREHRARG